MANLSLREGRELREDKVVKVVSGRQSYAEVLGLLAKPEEECFYSYKESIARVPRWLKEAFAKLERQAQKKGKSTMVRKNTQAPANSCGDRVMALTKTHLQLRITRVFVELGGLQSVSGWLEKGGGWLNGGDAEGFGAQTTGEALYKGNIFFEP
jgi:hypothetical protein